MNIICYGVKFTPNIIKNLEYPKKKDVIVMNLDGVDRLYRVLDIEEGIAKVMCYNFDLKSTVNNDLKITFPYPDTIPQISYANNNIDIYLSTTYYNLLSEDAKNAIIPSTRYQELMNGSSSKYFYYKISTTYGASINRYEIGEKKIFILGLKDIYEYFDKKSNVEVTANELNELYYNNESISNKNTFATTDTVRSSSGIIGISRSKTYDTSSKQVATNSTAEVNFLPVFYIDLSKIQYSFHTA